MVSLATRPAASASTSSRQAGNSSAARSSKSMISRFPDTLPPITPMPRGSGLSYQVRTSSSVGWRSCSGVHDPPGKRLAAGAFVPSRRTGKNDIPAPR
jgi:hypothetical protein